MTGAGLRAKIIWVDKKRLSADFASHESAARCLKASIRAAKNGEFHSSA